MSGTESSPFANLVASETELSEVIGAPAELAIRKQLSSLDAHGRAFIALSPFAAVGTVDRTGRGDVSPRGDAPGFAQVLDERHLAIPERPGNRRADTLRNILQTGTIGLLFIVPGREETLRVNGRAWLVRDERLLDTMVVRGKRPLLAIGVRVEEAYLHCAKAFKRSRLWESATWPDRQALPALAQMLLDQVGPCELTLDELDRQVEESYRTRLY